MILLDEPTSALDVELIGEVLAVLSELAKRSHTMVIATHAFGFAERVLVFDRGTIAEGGSAREVPRNPRTECARRFLAHGSAK